jgi:hypothetical protein
MTSDILIRQVLLSDVPAITLIHAAIKALGQTPSNVPSRSTTDFSDPSTVTSPLSKTTSSDTQNGSLAMNQGLLRSSILACFRSGRTAVTVASEDDSSITDRKSLQNWAANWSGLFRMQMPRFSTPSVTSRLLGRLIR